MKQITPFGRLMILAMLALFSSCEKVIDLELKDAEAAIVIDAGISDMAENQTVRISKTYSFTEANRFNGLAGAKVVLTTSNGNTFSYKEVSPGIYQSDRIRGRPDVTYTLDVTVEGKTYTAKSTMPQKVVLDSLTFKEFSFFGQSSTYVSANFNDPPGIQNQYRYILKVKGKIEEDVVSEDRFNDGNKVADVIFYEMDDLVSGDPVEVELQCIDRAVYKYFFSLTQSAGGGGPPVAPANPPSNFSNGALGVFNAYTTSKKSVVLQ